MLAIHDDLAAALDAVTIEAPDRYTIVGEPRDLRDVRPQAAHSPVLPAALATDLYARLYTRPRQGPRSAPPDYLAQRDHVAALSAANIGTGTWEPDWRIGETDEDGRIAVTKDDLTFWVGPNGLRARDGRVAPGGLCRVRVAKEIRGLIPGYFMAIGDGDADAGGDAEEPMLRLYWHLTAGAAADFIAATTRHLNTSGVPFRTKVLNDPALYTRADAGVLYFGRRDFSRVRQAVAAILAAVARGLRPDVPLFTKRIAPGLGLAEDPRNGLSFGQHRCELIAQGLWDTFDRGEHGRDARQAGLVAAFRHAGLDPLHPHLEPGSMDVYSLASPDERHRAIQRRERPMKLGKPAGGRRARHP
jgi:hypothetical protein